MADFNTNATEFNSNLVARIEALSRKKEALLTEKSMLDKQKADLSEKIKAQGFDPDKLPDEINKLTVAKQTFEAKALPILEELEKGVQTMNNTSHAVGAFPGFENMM
jgi:predicted transcriptional regulator